MWKYFTAKNTRVYNDILQDIAHGHNKSYHQSIGQALALVSLLNVGQVRRKLYGDSWAKPIRELKFKLGDEVRIIPRVPPVYWLQDYAEDKTESVFYAKELQKVHKSNDIYKIERILAEKKGNGKGKVLVKWLGYDKKFNSWTPKSELQKL